MHNPPPDPLKGELKNSDHEAETKNKSSTK